MCDVYFTLTNGIFGGFECVSGKSGSRAVDLYTSVFLGCKFGPMQ